MDKMDWKAEREMDIKKGRSKSGRNNKENKDKWIHNVIRDILYRSVRI
jgi:hypothetical protein